MGNEESRPDIYRNPVREIPSTKNLCRKKEQNNDGKDGDSGCRHEEMKIAAHFFVEVLQPDHKGPHLGLCRDDEGPEEGVPLAEKDEYSRSDESGFRQGDDNLPEVTETPRAIDLRCVPEVVGDVIEKLAKQEDTEDAGKPGDDKSGEIVKPSHAKGIIGKAGQE